MGGLDAAEEPIHAAMPMLVRGMRVVVRGVVSPDGAQVLPLEPQPRAARQHDFISLLVLIPPHDLAALAIELGGAPEAHDLNALSRRKLLVRLLRFLPMLVRQVQLVVDMVEVFEQLIGAVANDGALSITIKVPD